VEGVYKLERKSCRYLSLDHLSIFLQVQDHPTSSGGSREREKEVMEASLSVQWIAPRL
jgi:hypothetical protein